MAKSSGMRVLVIGGGIFGTAGALGLAQRGYRVDLVDPGPLPHPDASSTDISKVIRMDYGADAHYMELMEKALDGWRVWNEAWERPLFHETGFLLLTREGMRAGGYEYESFHLLEARGHRPERLDPERLAERFPAWAKGSYVDGYFNPEAGWAESGEVVRRLHRRAQAEGVTIHQNTHVTGLVERAGAVVGARSDDGQRWDADAVVVAAGAWTPKLIPELADRIRPVGQPVFHFMANPVDAYRPPRFVPWAADISNTGWYGFAALSDGTLKMANHGPGREVDPDGERKVDPASEATFRRFLSESIPGLARAPVLATRLCLYADTWDGDFYIDRDPDRPGLVVASGGSGHGFKFAPVLGDLIADAVEGNGNPYLDRFRWRQQGRASHEDARHAQG